MNILSERVITFRKEKGLTQEQLAEKIGVSRAVLGVVESGLRAPSKEMAKKLSVFFNVPLETFLMEDIQQAPKQSVSMDKILMIADVVKEYFDKNGYDMTPEQRVALVDYFYQQNIISEDEIKKLLSLMQALQFKGK